MIGKAGDAVVSSNCVKRSGGRNCLWVKLEYLPRQSKKHHIKVLAES